MKNKDFFINAHFKAKKDKIKELEMLLTGMLEPSRKEGGCISYSFFQSKEDPCSFVFIEHWASKQAFEAHCKTEHYASYALKAPKLFDKEKEVHFLLEAPLSSF